MHEAESAGTSQGRSRAEQRCGDKRQAEKDSEEGRSSSNNKEGESHEKRRAEKRA